MDVSVGSSDGVAVGTRSVIVGGTVVREDVIVSIGVAEAGIDVGSIRFTRVGPDCTRRQEQTAMDTKIKRIREKRRRCIMIIKREANNRDLILLACIIFWQQFSIW